MASKSCNSPEVASICWTNLWGRGIRLFVYRDIIQCLKTHWTMGIFFIAEKRYFVDGKERDSFAYRRQKDNPHGFWHKRYFTTLRPLYCFVMQMLIYFSPAYIMCVCVRENVRVYACMCDCVCVCGLDCVGALGLFKSPCIISPQSPFYDLAHHPERYQREHRNQNKVAGFDNECTEIHRLLTGGAPVILRAFSRAV